MNGEQKPIARFVGIGISEYDHYGSLPRARDEARQIAELLEPLGVQTILPTNTTERELDAELETVLLPREGTAEPLVILWAGHADHAPDAGLRLVAKNTSKQGTPLLTPERLMSMAARSGANQILLLFDTCFSGSGVLPAIRNADSVFGEYPDPQRRVWLGVVASAMDWEKSRDDLFGDLLAGLLRQGPTRTSRVDLRLQWSGKHAAIRGNALIETLCAEWEENAPHQLKVLQYGYRSEDLIPNPLHAPQTPETTIESLVRVAHGAEPDEERAYFTGRENVIQRLIAAVREPLPGMDVVTGPPGCGKSAVLGMLRYLSDPKQRSTLSESTAAEFPDASEFAIHAYFSAHRLALPQLIRALDHQLSDSGILDTGRRGRRDLGELVDAVRASEQCAVIVVDGLDEAGLEAWPIAEDVLRPLAKHARVIVGTRDGRAVGSGQSLVTRLQPDESAVIHLPQAVDDVADTHAYIVKRLTGVADSMDPVQVADAVRELPQSSTDSFLFARMLTAQLRESPIDTRQPDWQGLLATSVEQSFDRDVAALPALVRGTEKLPQAGRELLSALSWAQGAGLPVDIWPVVATALSPSGTTYTRDDAYWALGNAAAYIVEDGEVDHAAYRMGHQQLAEHLRGLTEVDEPELRIAQALAVTYSELLETGVTADQHDYLWRYFWRHCADAGPAGVDLLRPFADRYRGMFVPDLALASRYLAERLVEARQPNEATAPAETSVDLYRRVAAESPRYLPDLAVGLDLLGNRYSESGRWAAAVALAEEGVDVRRRLADTDLAFRPELANALSVLANRYAHVGRWREAVDRAAEAVDLYRAIVEADSGFRHGLAWALGNLGDRVADVGNRAEAVAYTTEAVEHYRTLNNENAAFRPELARTLNSLGAHFGQLGRRAEAVQCAEEAVGICRALAETDPRGRPDLAWALSNLGDRYGEAGNWAAAVARSEEAVALCRTLAAEDPELRRALAWMVLDLASRYSDANRSADAVGSSEEAVHLYAALVAERPEVVPDLAMANRSLGGCYAEVGRQHDAVRPVEIAAELYEGLAAENPAFVPRMASSLVALGTAYRNVGRRKEAVPPAERAVQLYESLVDDYPVFLPELAGALNQLGNRYGDVGRTNEALECGERAVELYEAAAVDNPAVLPGLADASSSLGLRYSKADRTDEAIPALEKAVELLRTLADTNPAYVPELAGTLTNLGIGYSDVGRPADAVEVTKTSVELYEQQAAASPAFLPALAKALRSLGAGLSAVGRGAEALAATERALTLYERQAAENPAYLPDLAATLNFLGKRYNELGRPEGIERTTRAVELYQRLVVDNSALLEELATSLDDLGPEADTSWRDALDALPTANLRAGLLIEKAHRESSTAIDDLLDALRVGAEASGVVVFEIHQLGRLLRTKQKAIFDAEWQQRKGALPEWLRLDDTVLKHVDEWLGLSSYVEARNCHRTYAEEFAAPDAFVALDELGLRGSDHAIIEQRRKLLMAANVQGCDMAYEPLLIEDLVRADVTEQLRQLDDDPALYLSDRAVELLRTWAGKDADNVAVARCEALVSLAREGLHHKAVAASQQPTEVLDFLSELLATGTPRQLSDAARFLLATELGDRSAAAAHFYQAVGLVETNQPEQAQEQLRAALQMDPASALRWVELLARRVTPPPRLVTLIPLLLADRPADIPGPRQPA